MAYELETVDYRGVTIVCPHYWWEGHIVSRHGYMEGQQAAVITALRDPYFVTRSAGYRDRRLYYRPLVLPAPYTNEYLIVVVDYPVGSRRVGRVVTAYKNPAMLRREALIWTKRDGET